MENYCNLACESEEDLIEVVFLCNDADNLIQVKADRYAFLKCSSNVVSLTDDAEWTQLKQDGKLIRTPQLAEFELAEPTTSKIKTKECAVSETVVGKTQSLPIDSILLDKDTKTDEDLVKDFYKKIGGYTVLLGACGNIIFYRKSWVSGENPGFGGLVGDLNFVTKTVGNFKYLGIKGAIEYDSTNQGWARIEVTDAVYNAIFK